MKLTHCRYTVLSVCILISAVFAVSCTSSSFEIPVPAESTTRSKNIAEEYYAIAEAYFDLKKYDKAGDYYKLAMRDRNLRAAAYYKLGRTYALSGSWAKAENVFRTLLRRDPENTNLQISIAYIVAMEGDYTTSFAMYRSLVEKNPDNPVVLENYIAVLINYGKIEKAEEQLFILKEKFPNEKEIDTLQKMIYGHIENPPAEDKKEAAADSSTSASPVSK